MNEFLVSIEKGKIIKSFDKFILGHGIGPYYRTNIIRSSVGREFKHNGIQTTMGLEFNTIYLMIYNLITVGH